MSDSSLLSGSLYSAVIAHSDKTSRTLAGARVSLGNLMMFDWDWSSAEAELKRAIELNPGYATAHHWYGIYLWQSPGRLDEALAEMKRAQELDPLSLVINTAVGQTLLLAGRNDEAIEQFRKTLDLNPNFPLAHQRLGLALAQESMYEEAIAELEKAEILPGGSAYEVGFLGYVYGVAGRKEEAERVLDQLQERSKQSYVSAISIAHIYMGLGRKDEAFDWLERSYREQEPLLTISLNNANPLFDSLRDDPRQIEARSSEWPLRCRQGPLVPEDEPIRCGHLPIYEGCS